MDHATQLDAIVEVFERLGIELRRERLGGTGGGLCSLRGKRAVFIDLDADLATQVDRCVRVLATLREVDAVYLAPTLREQIERARDAEQNA